jgi:plastocyanin
MKTFSKVAAILATGLMLSACASTPAPKPITTPSTVNQTAPNAPNIVPPPKPIPFQPNQVPSPTPPSATKNIPSPTPVIPVQPKTTPVIPVQPKTTPVTPKTTPPKTTAPVAKTLSVTIKDFAFLPATITVNAGDSVTWINKDSAPHSIKGSGITGGVSPTLTTGKSYSQKFATAGTFKYTCGIHPMMAGTVTVK